MTTWHGRTAPFLGKIRRQYASELHPGLGILYSAKQSDWFSDEERRSWQRWLTGRLTKRDNEPPNSIMRWDGPGHQVLVWPRRFHRKRHRRMGGK